MLALSQTRLSRTRTLMPIALLAAVAVTCLQGAAFAAVPMAPTQRTVSLQVAGLNLSNPADVQRLDARIRAAARTVCSPQNNRDLRAMVDRPACEATAISRATVKRDLLVARAQAEQLAARAQQVPATN